MSEADRWLKDFDYELDKIIENSKKADTATAFKLIRGPITLLFLSLLKKLEQKDKRIQELEEKVETKQKFIIMASEVIKNSIPKQAVIDKMDELGISDEDINIKYVLQELLEGEVGRRLGE